MRIQRNPVSAAAPKNDPPEAERLGAVAMKSFAEAQSLSEQGTSQYNEGARELEALMGPGTIIYAKRAAARAKMAAACGVWVQAAEKFETTAKKFEKLGALFEKRELPKRAADVYLAEANCYEHACSCLKDAGSRERIPELQGQEAEARTRAKQLSA